MTRARSPTLAMSSPFYTEQCIASGAIHGWNSLPVSRGGTLARHAVGRPISAQEREFVSDRHPLYEEPRPRTGRGSSFRPLRNRQDPEPRIWSFVGAAGDLVGAAVESALRGGLGVLFAPTSDGGAVSVTLYDGTERLRSYASTLDEYQESLQAVQDLGDSRSLGGPPARAVKPPR